MGAVANMVGQHKKVMADDMPPVEVDEGMNTTVGSSNNFFSASN
jgi:hypothetical protein